MFYKHLVHCAIREGMRKIQQNSALFARNSLRFK